MNTKHKDKVLDDINSYIIKALEDGVIPWRNPFEPHQGSSGHVYRGINRLVLTLVARRNKYTSHRWFTFNAQRYNGGCVRAGQKGTRIVYYGWVKRKKDGADDDMVPTFKSWHVWNADQIDWREDPEGEAEESSEYCNPQAVCADYLAREEIPLSHVAGGAWYDVIGDGINVPFAGAFKTPDQYLPTLFHEMGHSTGAAKRLNREGVNRDEFKGRDHSVYSKEELVAEMTAAYLCGHTSCGMDHLDQSAAYIQGWMERLKEDPKILHEAMHEAERAFQFILNGKVDYDSGDA